MTPEGHLERHLVITVPEDKGLIRPDWMSGDTNSVTVFPDTSGQAFVVGSDGDVVAKVLLEPRDGEIKGGVDWGDGADRRERTFQVRWGKEYKWVFTICGVPITIATCDLKKMSSVPR